MSELIKKHPQGKVLDQVDRIDGMINDLAGELNDLGSQLGPVLRPEVDGEGIARSVREASSPLADRLEDLGDRLQQRIDVVRDLRRHLDV